MSEDNQELLSQQEIDALLEEVEQSAAGGDELEDEERAAVTGLLAALIQADPDTLGVEPAGEESPQLELITAGDVGERLQAPGLEVAIDGAASARALVVPVSELSEDEEALQSYADKATTTLASPLGTAPQVQARVVAPEGYPDAEQYPQETPFVWVAWPGGGAACMSLAEARTVLDDAVPAAVQKGEEEAAPAEAADAQNVAYPELEEAAEGQDRASIELLFDVPLELTVVLGRTRRQVGEVLALGSGSIVELDKLAGEPVEMMVNGKLIARGEVVVIDEHFGVRITDIVSRAERLQQLR